jgi:hypothetical protein
MCVNPYNLDNDEVAVLDSVDTTGWVRSTDSATVHQLSRDGLLYRDDRGGWKLTGEGQRTHYELRVARGEVFSGDGYEPETLPELVDCRFHGNRIPAHRWPDTGTKRLVRCGGCGTRFERTPSENYAIDARLPVIPLDASALESLLTGGTQIVTLLDGTEALLRLAHPHELLARQHAACESVGASIGDGPAEIDSRKIDLARATELVTPPLAERRWSAP